jgi:hypothetical protein
MRRFCKPEKSVRFRHPAPFRQSSPGEQSADNRSGGGSIPSAGTRFYCGVDWRRFQLGLISQRRAFESHLRNHFDEMGKSFNGRITGPHPVDKGSIPFLSTMLLASYWRDSLCGHGVRLKPGLSPFDSESRHQLCWPWPSGLGAGL